MGIIFTQYLKSIVNGVPPIVYFVLGSLICIGFVWLLARDNKKRSLIVFFRVVFVEYLILLLSSTLLFRTTQTESIHFGTPFWSYRVISEGVVELLAEVVFNIIAFFPIGFLLSLCFIKIKWWQVSLYGLTLSIIIESLQFYFKVGIFEFDDIIHNSLGCLIGFAIGKVFLALYKYYTC